MVCLFLYRDVLIGKQRETTPTFPETIPALCAQPPFKYVTFESVPSLFGREG